MIGGVDKSGRRLKSSEVYGEFGALISMGQGLGLEYRKDPGQSNQSNAPGHSSPRKRKHARGLSCLRAGPSLVGDSRITIHYYPCMVEKGPNTIGTISTIRTTEDEYAEVV